MLDFLLPFYYLYLNSKILIKLGGEDKVLFLVIGRNRRNFFSTIVWEGVKTYSGCGDLIPSIYIRKAPLNKGLIAKYGRLRRLT